MAEVNYDIDKDAIKSEVDAERDAAIAKSDAGYDSIIATNKATESGLLADIEENRKRQEEIANKNTEFAIEEINQNKANTKKDYIKEQSAAYKDYQKQSDPYGVNAEQRAEMGMSNTGYSESAKVAMYNQYQARVATARESYVRAVQNYDNAITQARLQNSSTLAEIAAESLAQSLEVSINFASQNNALLTEKVKQRTEIDQNYYNRYLAVLDQINAENTLAENVRQHNESLEEEKRQYDATLEFQREQFEYQKEQDASSGSGTTQVKGKSGSSVSVKKQKASNSVASINKNAVKTAVEKTKEAASNAKKSPTPDMKSVLALGYGPISEKRLDELIRQGKVKEYEENGKLKYKKVFTP